MFLQRHPIKKIKYDIDKLIPEQYDAVRVPIYFSLNFIDLKDAKCYKSLTVFLRPKRI